MLWAKGLIAARRPPRGQRLPRCAVLSAALLRFVSLTGLILIYFLHKHRFSSLLARAGGAAIADLVYAFFVT